jgi:hypothetical protein
MRTILFAAFAAASVLALPTFAQVSPTGTGTSAGSSAHAGVSTTGALSNAGAGGSSTDAGASASSDATGTSNLGLGGLLKQTQATEPSTNLDGSAALTNPSDAKALEKKARAHGH